ncbi:thioredoxin-like protein, partial [Cyathus striatus]
MFATPHISSISQYKTVISGKAYAVLYIYTTTCPACESMTPVVERISNARRMSEDIKFYKINAYAEWGGLNKLLQELKIEGYPTILVFRQNEIVVQGCGSKPIKIFEVRNRVASNFSSR